MNPEHSSGIVRLRDILREKQLWLLIVLGVLYFQEPLFQDRTFFFRDLYLHFFPQRHLFAQMIKSGELPLWDPYIHGGQPFLGDVQNLTVYPTGFLYLILPVITAFNLDLVLHVILCSVAAYFLARVLRFSPTPAMIAGILYGYNGYTLSLANLMNRLLAMPYLPLVLLFWHLFLTERRWRWFLIAAVCGAFQLFAGAPEMTLITFSFVLLWSTVYPYPVPMIRRMALWSVLVMFVVGLSAIQLLPGIEMTSLSSRSAPENYLKFSGWSLNPKRLPELAVSNFFGYTDKVTRRDYWGSKNEDQMFPYILNIYFGAITFLLAAAAAFRNAQNPLPARVRFCLFFVLLASIVLSLGRFLPFFESLYKIAFLLNRLRYPIKFLVGGVLPVSLLAASSFEMLFHAEQKPKRILAAIWIFSGFFSIILCLFHASNQEYTRFLGSYFGQTTGVIRDGVLTALTHTAVIGLSLTLVLQLRVLRPQSWQRPAFAALIALDLFYSGYYINWYTSREFFRTIPNVARLVWREKGDGRFFRGTDKQSVVIQVPGNDVVYIYRWLQETLEGYIAPGYGIPVMYHQNYDGLAKKEVEMLGTFLLKTPWDQRGPVLTASAISVIFTAEHVDLPGIHLVAEVRVPSRSPFYLYRNTNSQRVRFVTNSVRASNEQDAFEKVTSPSFDPTSEAILQNIPQSVSGGPACSPRIETLASRMRTKELRVVNPCPGYLIFAETNYPGWEVSIDHKPAAILPANFAFSGVRLEAGDHTVERSYRPSSARYGLLATLLSTTILVTVTLLLELKAGRPTLVQ